MKRISAGAILQAYFSDSLALARQISKPEHRANPFVNILNTTTKSTQQYPDLLGEKTMYWRFCHSLTGVGITLWRALCYANNKLPLHTPADNPDVLLLSHLTNPDHLLEDTDFYFGNLAAELNHVGISTHTLLINHCRAGASQAKSMHRKKTTLLPAFRSPIDEFFGILRLIKGAITLPSDGASITNNRFRRLAKAAQFGSRAIGDFRIGQMISEIISTIQPRVIIHTFEGHGWERIATATAHALPTPAYVIGYQHAVLFPGDKSLYHDHGGGTVPDHIFTTGDTTRDILAEDIKFFQGQISSLGSIKHKSPAPKIDFRAQGTCLFAPEGTLEEVRVMAQLAIDAARLDPAQTFVLRLHPVINPSDFDSMIAAWPPTPSNFILSTAPLDNDLDNASWICYRGSTVAFQGILAGLRPIYLNPDDNVADNNPVPENIKFQRCASGPQDLINILHKDQNTLKEGREELPAALEFASSYFSPFRPDIAVTHIKNYLP